MRRPTLDCFDVLGIRRPIFDDGRPDARPKTPRWCGYPAPDEVPARPAPFAPGACLEVRYGRAWRRYDYDAAGRLIRAREERRGEARWYYEGDTLIGYKDLDETLYRYDAHGRLIRIEGKSRWVEIERDAAGRIVGRLSLRGLAGEQTECVSRYDPETGALIEQRCVDEQTGSIETTTVHWDPELDAWEQRRVEDDVEEILVWRCDAEGLAVYDLEAGFDAAGRLVRSRDRSRRCEAPDGQRMAYAADGALIAQLNTCSDTWGGVASMVFADGRPVCQTRHNHNRDFTLLFDWPPFRREQVDACAGACDAYPDLIRPHGEVSMVIPEWSAGRHSRLHLDANADGHVDQIIDLPAEYDAEGRLIREAMLGPFDVEQVEYRYDCE